MLMNFGALLVPVFYLMTTHFRGAVTRLMVIGVGLQAFWSICIFGFVFFAGRAGFQDAYKAYALLLVVNVVSLIYYLALLVKHVRLTKGR